MALGKSIKMYLTIFVATTCIYMVLYQYHISRQPMPSPEILKNKELLDNVSNESEKTSKILTSRAADLVRRYNLFLWSPVSVQQQQQQQQGQQQKQENATTKSAISLNEILNATALQQQQQEQQQQKSISSSSSLSSLHYHHQHHSKQQRATMHNNNNTNNANNNNNNNNNVEHEILLSNAAAGNATTSATMTTTTTTTVSTTTKTTKATKPLNLLTANSSSIHSNIRNRTTTKRTTKITTTTTSAAAAIKINENSKTKLKKFLAETSPPPLYIITPTYRRPEQLAELTRLGYTLKHIVNLLWLVIEDANRTSPLVTQTLNRIGVPYEYLVAPMPEEYKKTKKAKPRGVSNRNRGLQWLRENATEGVFYFADDDNTYDITIFEQMRYTKKVSMWPVGLVTKYGVSSPIIRNGKVDGFYDGWIGGRKYAVDMAGFAVSVKFLHDRPAAKMPFKPGYEEDGFLKSLAPLNNSEIELLASECTEILTWHTQTKKNQPAERLNMTKYGNTNLVSIDKVLVRP